MGSFKRDEIEQAFRKYWHAGAVAEDWNGFAEMFTEDAQYVEHVLGSMRGREAIRSWIVPIMEQYCELYTAYEWHTVDEDADRVIVYMQNRRDHPSGSGTIDFPGITILHYAGGGLFDLEEDFWSVPGGQATTVELDAGCEVVLRALANIGHASGRRSQRSQATARSMHHMAASDPIA
ncbi:MAG: nuclear transport factor 2 family protein [Deltaproteobacteria bacterium]|nr:nuclear transport factor 2 family protein [Deltaproteobacteria bacterium]